MVEGVDQKRDPTSRLRDPLLWVAVILLLLIVAQWWEARERMSGLRDETANRLAQSDRSIQEGHALARADREALAALQSKIGVLEARLAETQSQSVALEAMYQDIVRGRDERLLAEIDFSPSRDHLVLVGDLVNRGPGSLATLKRLRGLGDAATCLVGNHDLHLLAVAAGVRKAKKSEQLDALLQARVFQPLGMTATDIPSALALFMLVLPVFTFPLAPSALQARSTPSPVSRAVSR